MMVSFPCGRISTCSTVSISRSQSQQRGNNEQSQHWDSNNLSFHPWIIHLIDEGVRHLQGRLLLLSICSISWLKWHGEHCVRYHSSISIRYTDLSRQRSSRWRRCPGWSSLPGPAAPSQTDSSHTPWWPSWNPWRRTPDQLGRRHIHNLMLNGGCWSYLPFF